MGKGYLQIHTHVMCVMRVFFYSKSLLGIRYIGKQKAADRRE